MTNLISICLCTYKRSSVVDTLNGISNLILPDDCNLEVVVIDSDLKGSALNLVDQFINNNASLNVDYYKADKPGVVIARNLAVSKAKGHWIAFIDDDEIPDKNWLNHLYASALRFKANVVFGKVSINYPNTTPKWILKSDIFSYGKTNLKTGSLVNTGATSNVLIKKKLLLEDLTVFDIQYNETGGEDSELFLRIGRKHRMIFCKEAIVTETVEEKRLNYKFLIKRAIRSGETYYNIFHTSTGMLPRLIDYIIILTKLILAVLIAITSLFFGLSYSIKFHIKAGANLGKLKSALGFRPVKLYKVNFK